MSNVDEQKTQSLVLTTNKKLSVYSNTLARRGVDLVKELFHDSINVLHKLAEQGDPEAQYMIGHMYLNQEPIDDNEIIKWWRKSAEQGHVKAQRNLGVWYDYGFGVSQDYNEAEKWYRKAAKQGDSIAQCLLGSVCMNMGKNSFRVAHDYNGAIKWYREAIKWYSKSADQGDISAIERLKELEEEK